MWVCGMAAILEYIKLGYEGDALINCWAFPENVKNISAIVKDDTS